MKKKQFSTIPTDNARFKHPINGGFRYNLDFMYPMISELRLKEKIIPLDFYFNSFKNHNWQNIKQDPYDSIRNSIYLKSSCYFLDARIQNWFNSYNVIWNDYFHFFLSDNTVYQKFL